MKESVKLYDWKNEDEPPCKPGEYRVFQVCECPICSALTNRVRHFPRGGLIGLFDTKGIIKFVCLNGCECWHHELEEKVCRLLFGKGHPKVYREALEKEIDETRGSRKSEIKNDLVGNPDLQQKIEANRTNIATRWHRENSFCKHFSSEDFGYMF